MWRRYIILKRNFNEIGHHGHIVHEFTTLWKLIWGASLIARCMGPTWGPPGSCWPQMGPMLAPWTLLSVLPSQWELSMWQSGWKLHSISHGENFGSWWHYWNKHKNWPIYFEIQYVIIHNSNVENVDFKYNKLSINIAGILIILMSSTDVLD